VWVTFGYNVVMLSVWMTFRSNRVLSIWVTLNQVLLYYRYG